MRYSALAIAPFVAAAFAQADSMSQERLTSTSTYTYSNTMTNFLSLTNSLGVVTGMPTLENGGAAVTSQPALPDAVTSQPALATIPAGLPSGVDTVYIGGGSSSVSSFLISVGSSTTEVIGGAIPTGASIVGGSASVATGDSQSTGSSDSDSPSATSDGSPSSTESSASQTTSSAAGSIKVASGAVLGLGALFAALL